MIIQKPLLKSGLYSNFDYFELQEIINAERSALQKYVYDSYTETNLIGTIIKTQIVGDSLIGDMPLRDSFSIQEDYIVGYIITSGSILCNGLTYTNSMDPIPNPTIHNPHIVKNIRFDGFVFGPRIYTSERISTPVVPNPHCDGLSDVIGLF